MSHKYPTEHELGQLKRACRRCGAQPHEWCRVRGVSGSKTTFLHVVR